MYCSIKRTLMNRPQPRPFVIATSMGGYTRFWKRRFSHLSLAGQELVHSILRMRFRHSALSPQGAAFMSAVHSHCWSYCRGGEEEGVHFKLSKLRREGVDGQIRYNSSPRYRLIFHAPYIELIPKH